MFFLNHTAVTQDLHIFSFSNYMANSNGQDNAKPSREKNMYLDLNLAFLQFGDWP